MAVREKIFETAAASPESGALTETLKWGGPAYLTEQTKSGTTVRIAWRKRPPSQNGIYVNCRTTLIDTFRGLFPEALDFEGNRGLVFNVADEPPTDALEVCIAAALTYHRDKRRRTTR